MTSGADPAGGNEADGGAARAAQRVVLITGMSGAGRSTALRVLEDLGYEAIDNLPLSLLGRLLAAEGVEMAGPRRPLAVDLDIRSRGFHAEGFVSELAALRGRPDLDVTVVFIDCDDQVLRRRFTETRRRHPLAADRPLADGLRLERELMARLDEVIDLRVDTSNLSAAGLRDVLSGHFRPERGAGMTVTVTSFAYRRGLPREADLVFDVRFLSNPHYVPALKPLTGRDPRVAAHILGDPTFAPFFDRLGEFVRLLLPHYVREGKTYLTIAVGCTGGRHRSVFVAEKLAALLRAGGRTVNLRHRDLDEGERANAEDSD